MDNAQTQSQCEICGQLEVFILAKTGYGETLPAGYYRLTKASLSTDLDIHRCPRCDSIFLWQDFPQFYGSGNLDEEHLTRLDEAKAQLVRDLVNLPDDPLLAPQLLEAAFSELGAPLTLALLRSLRHSRSIGFDHLLPSLVCRLQKGSEYSVRELLFGWCRENRVRCRRLADLIDGDPRPKNYQSDELRKQCEKWLTP